MSKAILARALAGQMLLCLAVLAGACREDEDLTVKKIEFRGTTGITPAQLKAVMATKEGGRLPWSKKPPFDRKAFEVDLDRIKRLYQDNGYPDGHVVAFSVDMPKTGDAVSLRLTVDEGQPRIVDAVRYEGFDVIPAAHLEAIKKRTPIDTGEPPRQQQLVAARDMATRELQDHGYPYAQVSLVRESGERARHDIWILRAQPGPVSHFGPVEINGNVSVSDNVISRELTMKPGDLFRVSTVHQSQRNLYSLDLFQFANVEPRLGEDQNPEVPLRITIAEAKPRELRGSVGYGSEEKARGEIEWRHKNFFGDARTASVQARWSSLDRGVRLNFSQPFFLGRQTLAVSGQQWYTNEPAYWLNNTGLRLTVTRERNRRDPVIRRGARTSVSGSYVLENERYEISNEALSDLTLRNQLIALGLDPRTGTGQGLLSAAAFDVRRDTTTNLLDARHGYVVTGHVERAGGVLSGDFDYFEVSGEGRHYLTIADRFVWANRVQIGSITSPHSVDQVPFFKRYFLGGSTSLRGWGRFEVAPLSGSGLPIGGFSYLAISSELRVAAFGNLGLVGFVDAGNVYATATGYDLGDLRYDVGPGFRYKTPIGPLRFDIGYQLNPIPGLLIDGQPQTRRWRMHFSIGHSF